MIKQFAVAMLSLALLAGCAGAKTTKPTPAQDPRTFLAGYGIEVEPKPEEFTVTVPKSWEVPLGEYPEGLYWGMAAVFSKEAGLDLTALKGKTVTVDRYPIVGGLPGEGEQSQHSYPSDAVVLTDSGKVVGAWLAFGKWYIGPSVTKRNLEQITGLTFDRWVEQQGYFKDPGPNADLATMGPGEVLAAYLDAVTKGDKRRANACLTPSTLRDALTTNLPSARLYHPGFGTDNSMSANIVKGKLLSYEMMEPGSPWGKIDQLGDRTRVELTARLELTWRMSEFNTPDGKATRFALMIKGANGWKLAGLGTGP